jgi:hypothetical protein
MGGFVHRTSHMVIFIQLEFEIFITEISSRRFFEQFFGISYMTEERSIIEKRDAAGFENAEGIKLSILRKILLKAEVVKRQQ